jgi:hypothetical protein
MPWKVKTWSGTMMGLNGIIPHDLQPHVPMPTVADLDQAAAKTSPNSHLVKFLPGLFFIHPFPSAK